MLIKDIVPFSERLKETSSLHEKVRILNELWSLSGEDLPYVAKLMAGEKIRIGAGYATLIRALKSSREGEGLSIRELFDFLDRYAHTKGRGSLREKVKNFEEMFSNCTKEEKDLIIRYMSSELRQGAGRGVILKSLARYFGLDEDALRKEYAYRGSISECVKAILEGRRGTVSLFQPVHPMLGYQAENIKEGIKDCGLPCISDLKIDGIRVQLHKSGRNFKVFSRNLRDITELLPELKSVVEGVRGDDLILDGEAIVRDDKGQPLPFQEIISAISDKTLPLFRKRDVTAYFFDIIYIGKDVTNEPLIKRKEILHSILPDKWLMPSIYSESEDEIENFFKRSIESGNEGIMLKRSISKYHVGKRSKDWIKVKRYFTLDLVIIAGEWGHGRRSRWLSNYHLGIRHGKDFLMVGKTFKGLTDEEFERITKTLLRLKTSSYGNIVKVKPEVVVEVAFDEVQKSSRYDSGFALRFARIKNIRWDKNPMEANTIEELARLYNYFREHKGTS